MISEHLTLHCSGGGGGVGGSGGGEDGFGRGGFRIFVRKQFIVHILAPTAHGLRHLESYSSQLGGILEQGIEQ